MLKSWSSTQSIIALSSGEAEYYAMLKGTSCGCGIQAMMEDLGVFLGMAVYTDSKAASGIAQRRGLGKTRHIKVAYLGLQEKVNRREVTIRRVSGPENPADLMTKHLAEAAMDKHRRRLGCTYREGRHPLMPKVNM